MNYFLVLLLCLLIYSTSTNNVNSDENVKPKGNILCLMIVPSPSHHVWNRSLMKALAKDGYNITAVSVDVDKDPTPNLHYIHLEGVYDALYNTGEPVDFLATAALDAVDGVEALYQWQSQACKSLFKTSGSKTIMGYPGDFKFDLVIYDMTLGPCFLPILDRFPKAPIISVSAFSTPVYSPDVTGTPLFPAYIPHYGLIYSSKMSFFQRSVNLALHIIDSYYRKTMIAEEDVVLREYFGNEMKKLDTYENRAEILLVNSHPSMQFPQSLLPNVVQVGGLQIAEPSPLPHDIETFISSAARGSVLFSLGTNMKSEMLGPQKIQMFINAIKRLPQYNFLWKFESDTIPALPKNLMIKKWIPQNDILAHPNVKLFLSHCGLLSTQEATWHGVPVLAMPFFADQYQNAQILADGGSAEQLNIFETSEDDIYNKLKKMLEKESYSRKMKQRSTQFRDRPQHPLELALYWCKYLIRNGNAQHLRSPAMEMSHFVQHMWDVLLAFVVFIVSLGFLSFKIANFVSRRLSVKIKTN